MTDTTKSKITIRLKPVSSPPHVSVVPKFIEACAGAGGLSTGLIQAGWRPLLLNDNDADCCHTLRTNHPNVKVVNSSMLDLDLTPYRDTVDLLTGGVPCQSFSQAGLRKGLDDPRGNLMYRFADLIDQVNPKLFMIENVKGLLTHDHGRTLETILSVLNRHHLYHVTSAILNANDYGVPQKRERIIIVGRLKTLGTDFIYPVSDPSRPVLREVLQDVPPSEGIQYSEEKRRLFGLIPPGGCWVNLPVELQKSYLGASYLSGDGKRGILRRLSMDQPSLTIMCTPSQKQTERCHPVETRPLTIRETTRIQTFGDTYQFHGSITSQYKQIGNAVPPRLAYRLGQSLLTVISK